MNVTFVEFVDRKQRETIKQLEIVKGILRHADMQVASFIHSKHDDPYIFVYNPTGGTNFGIRIYKIGEQLAYRIQRREKTHPYGQASPLDIETIWDDLKSDGKSSEEAVHEIVKAVADELKDYFKQSSKASKELRKNSNDEGPLGTVQVSGNTGTDYSDKVTNT